jgi:hypothetical protein
LTTLDDDAVVSNGTPGKVSSMRLSSMLKVPSIFLSRNNSVGDRGTNSIKINGDKYGDDGDNTEKAVAATTSITTSPPIAPNSINDYENKHLRIPASVEFIQASPTTTTTTQPPPPPPPPPPASITKMESTPPIMSPLSIKDTVGSNNSSNTNNNNNSGVMISHNISASNSNYDSNDEDDEVLAPIPMKVLPFKAPSKKTTFYLEATDDLDASFSQPNPLKAILPPPPPPPPSKLLQTNTTKDISGTVMSGNLLLKPNRPKSVKRADIDALPRIISTDDDNDDAAVLDRTGTPLLSPTQSLLSKSSAVHSSLLQPPPPQSTVLLSSSLADSERHARTNLFNSIKLGNAQLNLRSSTFESNENTPVKLLITVHSLKLRSVCSAIQYVLIILI